MVASRRKIRYQNLKDTYEARYKQTFEYTGCNNAKSTKIYWEMVKSDSNKQYRHYVTVFRFFESNAVLIRKNNLGDLKSEKSKAFNIELNHLKSEFAYK